MMFGLVLGILTNSFFLSGCEGDCGNTKIYPFRFDNGENCIRMTAFCDGGPRSDCNDGSDEEIIPGKHGRICSSHLHPTSDKKCLLPEEFICQSEEDDDDELVDCKGGIDECLCSDQEIFIDEKCFRCLTFESLVIPIAKFCDGIIDCPDLSDECLCHERPSVCHQVEWDAGMQPELPCATNPTTTADFLPMEAICNGRIDCGDGLDEWNCTDSASFGKNVSRPVSTPSGNPRKSFRCPTIRVGPKYATKCDGIPECFFAYEEECECPYKPAFCDSFEQRRFKCNSSGFSTAGYKICDGKRNCPEMEEEISCPQRFYCGPEPIPNFPMKSVCDKVDDCEDGRDEIGCSHFYCEDGGHTKYLDFKQVCDGNRDCESASDECQPGCIDSVFSNEKSMIKSKAILTFVSIQGVTAFVGNVIVIFLMIQSLLNSSDKRNGKKLAKLNSVLLLNLAISDLLVAVYIIAILIKSISVEGEYCFVDRNWRSSAGCSVLGALLVIGSEESVFTMVLITATRVKSVYKPFEAQHISKLFIVIFMTWILSFAIAFIPLIPSLQDNFVHEIWYEGFPIFSKIEREEAFYLTHWLTYIFGKTNAVRSNGFWLNLEEFIKNINPNLTVHRKFGYYSTHTVCLPMFFPSRDNESTLIYSLAIVLLNFLSFFFIAIGYWLMLGEAKKTNIRAAEGSKLKKTIHKQNTQMQRKLTRIIMSDFFCWMPVSVMAFCTLAGVDIPKDSYLLVGLIIIPINSALNPFLYSTLPDRIWRRLATASSWMCFKCLSPNSSAPQVNFDQSGNDAQTQITSDEDAQKTVEISVIERGKDEQENGLNVSKLEICNTQKIEN